MAQASNNERELASAPIGKLMVRLALPAVLAQFINVLYNVVDRIYIGHIPGTGALALTGVGVTMPIILLISAFAAFAGMGGAPLASIQLGAGNRERAERILSNSFSMLLILSVVLTIFFRAFSRPLLYAFGASDNIIGYGLSYINLYVLGTVFVQLALGLNTFISAQGHATTAMLSVLIGAVINIVLDPILIFVFNMGVQGAAVATVISQACSAAWALRFLTSKKSSIRIRLSYMKLQPKIALSILGLGIAPFIMQSTESLVTITLNSGLQTYGGDLYVGSMTVMQSVMQSIMMPMQGISQGVQPILSYNYGAGNYQRVRDTFKLLFKVTVALTVICCLVVVLFPGMFGRIFTSDAEQPGNAHLLRRHLDVWLSAVLPVPVHGSGPGQDQPVPGAAAKGDPAGSSGYSAAHGNRQCNQHFCGRAHRRYCGQRHFPAAVLPQLQAAAAGNRTGKTDGRCPGRQKEIIRRAFPLLPRKNAGLFIWKDRRFFVPAGAFT